MCEMEFHCGFSLHFFDYYQGQASFYILLGCLHFLFGNVPHIPTTHFPEASFTYLYAVFWRKKWQPTPVFLPGESHGQRSLADYGPWGHKESDMTERLHSLCW